MTENTNIQLKILNFYILLKEEPVHHFKEDDSKILKSVKIQEKRKINLLNRSFQYDRYKSVFKFEYSK